MGRRLQDPGHSPQDYAIFLDLVVRMLTYDPEKRIRPTDAMAHQFLSRGSGMGGGGGVCVGPMGVGHHPRQHSQTQRMPLQQPTAAQEQAILTNPDCKNPEIIPHERSYKRRCVEKESPDYL